MIKLIKAARNIIFPWRSTPAVKSNDSISDGPSNYYNPAVSPEYLRKMNSKPYEKKKVGNNLCRYRLP